MKRFLLFLCLSFCCGIAQTLLDAHLKMFSYEERIERKFIQQMRFDSIYAWRGWGMLNTGVRNNLVGGKEDFLNAMPQTGFDRSYPLTNGVLFLGADLSGSGGTLDNGSQKLLFAGYGMGGYLMWKNDFDVFTSLSLKMVQVFQRAYDQWFNHLVWIGDIGGGKRFKLNEGYFFDVSLFVGSGLISATNLTLRRQPLIRLSSPINVPFSIMSVFSMGRQINQDQVKVSISPVFETYLRGKIYEEADSRLNIIQKSKTHFDVLLSIDYDVRMFDETNFFIYADFNAAQLEMMFGAGFRVEFGENRYYPLEYPKIKLEKLKKTYLK